MTKKSECVKSCSEQTDSFQLTDIFLKAKLVSAKMLTPGGMIDLGIIFKT